jgi:xylulokinase
MGVQVEEIRLGGGGARSRLWRQIQADVYGQPVKTVAAEEGAAFGAALLAGVAAGIWSSVDAACDTVVRIADHLEPNAESVKILAQQYERFKQIYPALKPITE